MNKTAIKHFAIWARKKLISDVSYAAGLIGITESGIAKPLPQSFEGSQFFDIGTAEPYSISGEAVRQRERLEEVIRQKEKDSDYHTAYRYVIEEVAYTWFNRLIAIRFMELNDYLPSHIRVLSSESGKLEPDLVTTPFDAELPFTAEEETKVLQLKQDNKLDELFRILFLKQCNALHEILPALFEKTKNYTELLLSLSVIDQDGVVYHLIHDIPEEDFNIERGGQVEIIGWLYQYYNTEPKAVAFAKKGKITKEEIPAVTQLFTPDWIVRYMVENSLGRLWVEGHPDCGLKEGWKYYLEEAEQEPEVQDKLNDIRKEYASLDPEDIKLIDPCMGSGHILVYAFDVLMQIYESAGYSQRDAAKSILEHNIYGLDIDERAYQLAYFAVMMKARQYNRRILNGENSCHIYAIQESNHINRAHLQYFGAGMEDRERDVAKMQLEGLLDTLTDAKEYGSILKVENYDWELLRRFVGKSSAQRSVERSSDQCLAVSGQITMDSVDVEDTAEQLRQLIAIGEMLARKYWVTVTNPPYAGTSNLSARVNDFVKKNYPDSKNDLSTVFMERATDFCMPDGYWAMINIPVWMFLSGFEKLRGKLLMYQTIVNMVHPGRGIFGSDFGTTTFVIAKRRAEEYRGKYYRLFNKQGEVESIKERENAFLLGRGQYSTNQNIFSKIPGSPVAYWASKAFADVFSHQEMIGTYCFPKQGLHTGNNEKYLRLWSEVDMQSIMTSESDSWNSDLSWAKLNKGGAYRKWYGNRDYIIFWEKDGDAIKNNGHSVGAGNKTFFHDMIGFTDITSYKPSFRYYGKGFVYDVSGPSMFNDEQCVTNKYLLGLLNSKICDEVMGVLSPTIHMNQTALSKMSVIRENVDVVESLVDETIHISKLDWDSFEASWDFKKHPLLRNVPIISEAFQQWKSECDARFNKLKSNEEELNRIFIEIYGLQDELTPEVEDKDVTVRKADLQRDIKSLLSYAVGCMFGRYSLDVEGLAYAGGEWDNSKYRSFLPDADNVIPLTEEEYLDDDIVARLCEWLKVVYGEKTLEENLDFIAKALGNKGNSSREIIRNYFLNDFFKDHCQTYSVTGSGKRPIYWLFDSGRQNGFKALIYLHRYTPDTIGNLRIDYLHRMQHVYESEINRMQDMMDHSENAREAAAAEKRREKLAKQLKECREYDEKIAHLALSRIELDLDDGVKVNYRKIQTGRDGKFYEVLADSRNIMAKQREKT